MPETSFSKIKTYRRCPRQYHYKYNERLRRKRKALPLVRGTILHEVLEAWKNPGIIETPNEIFEKYEKEFKEFFLEEQEEHGDIPGDMRRIFQGYVREYKDDQLEYESFEEFVATDLAPNLRFVGYIDNRVRDRNNLRFIMDHKTHKVLPNEEKRFSDIQLVFYVWAFNREHSTSRVDGVLWDYIRTKPPAIPEQLKNGELSQRKNIDTDYHTYMSEIKRLKLDPEPYSEILNQLKNRESSFFRRVFLPSPPKAMIETVVEDMRTTAKMALKLGSYATRNLTHDCPTCEFYELCHAELRGLDHKFIQKARYEVKEPTEHGHEEVTN